MKCVKCGGNIKKSYKMCPTCGEPVIFVKKENHRAIIFIISIMFIFLLSVLSFGFIKTDGVKTIRKSVLKVNVYNKGGELIQTGSGFIVFEKNILVTNAHVITGGYDIEAISESDERVYVNGALYYSQDEDIAILRLNEQNSIEPLKITTKYDVGDDVIAIGSPLGIKNSVSGGMISNILMDDNAVIQHSAPISHGSSGGTLFNSKGKVIGMNTATITEGQNINLAIPIEVIEKAYQKSKNNKVKEVQKIQFVKRKGIESVVLNNNAGKEIIDIISEESKAISFYSTECQKSGYIDSYFMKRIVNEGYASDWIRIYANSDFDDEYNFHESIIPEIVIIKMNDVSDDIVQPILELLRQDALSTYDSIIENPEYEVLDPTQGKLITSYYSSNYIDAYCNPVINVYNDYIYMIISSDSKLITKLENEIKKLP